MQQFVTQAASLYKNLLSEHENHIYTHESIGYRIDHAVKTLEFDDSGITAMVAIKDLLSLLRIKGYIKISSFDSDLNGVMQFYQDYSKLKEVIQQSQIVERLENMSRSIEKYFNKAEQGITDNLRNFLKDHSSVVDVYTKTLKSSKEFDVFPFSKGENAVDGNKLELFSPVYVWRDYNSLQAHYKKFDDGVYFCFVDHVFAFVIKNGENFIVVSDPMEYNRLRRHLSNRYIPYQKNKVDAGFYLPYSLIDHRSGKLELKLYDADTTEAFANQDQPSILCDVADLPVASLVYVVLMFELLVKKYGFNTELLDAQPIIKHGTTYIFESAIEHKASQNLITVDELRHGVYHSRFPESSYLGLNVRLEEMFSGLVDQRLLNLVSHNKQMYYPDEAGRYVPFTEKIKYNHNEYGGVEELKLHAFDLTMIGTPEQLEELRYNVARNNYAAMLNMHSKIYMREKFPDIREYLEKKFYKNIDNLETIMGFSKILVPDQKGCQKPWLLMSSEKYEPKEYSHKQAHWVRTMINQRDPKSSVLRCYHTGSKRYQTVLFRVATAEQLACLLNVPVSKLPEPLNQYSWVSNNHHSLNDPVDALWDIWEQRLIEFEVIVSKSHYNHILKKTAPQYLEQIKAIGQL